jgi:flagellar hook-associated protein 1
VQVAQIERTRDQFLDYQIRGQLSTQGQVDVQNDGLAQVEAAFNEPSSTSLSNLLSTYFAAWNDVANNPTDTSARTSLVSDAQAVAAEFNRVDGQLKQQQGDADGQLQISVQSVNSDAQGIAALNQQIVQVEAGGMKANDLRDQRDQLLDNLSSLVKVNYTEASNGAVNVFLGDRQLVSGSQANQLKTTLASGQPFSTVQWADGGSVSSLSGGKIGGLITLRDSTIPGVQANLSATAARLIQSTNSIHASGVGLDGVGGRPFFDGTDAGTITVDPTIAQDPTKVAAARQYVDPSSGALTFASGDGSNAQAMANLQQATAQLDSSATLQPGASLGGATVLGVDISGAAPASSFTLSASGSSVTIAANGAVQVLDASATLGVRITLSAPAGGATPANVASALAGTTLSTATQGASIGDQYAAQIGQLGVQASAANNTSTNQGLLVTNLTQQRQSMSGVSLDEEATNLVQYQHAYQAAARVLSTVDAMLDTLINSMG